MIVYLYEKCSTCRAALDFLKKRGATVQVKEITKQAPSIAELQQMLDYQKGNLRRLFNTSGLLYKEMQLKERLPHLSVAEAFALLHQHGMLVKRPFLLGDGFGIVGFQEAEWSKNIAGKSQQDK